MDILNVLIQGLLLGGLYALFATGLSLMFGVMRIVNLAHGDLAVVAAYLALIFLGQNFLPVWLVVVITIPVFGLIGYITQRGLLNRSQKSGPLATLLVTFGLSIVLQNVMQQLFSADTKTIDAGWLTTAAWQVNDQISISYLALLTLVLALGIHHLHPALPHPIGPGADDASLVRRPPDRRGGRWRLPAHLRDRDRYRVRNRRAGRPHVRHALVVQPDARPVAAALRIRGGRDRRSRFALGHARGRCRARTHPDSRRHSSTRPGRSWPVTWSSWRFSPSDRRASSRGGPYERDKGAVPRHRGVHPGHPFRALGASRHGARGRGGRAARRDAVHRLPGLHQHPDHLLRLPDHGEHVEPARGLRRDGVDRPAGVRRDRRVHDPDLQQHGHEHLHRSRARRHHLCRARDPHLAAGIPSARRLLRCRNLGHRGGLPARSW